MRLRELLTGTALTTALLMGGTLPALANTYLPIGGYGGPIQLKFYNYESFLNPSTGAIATTPTVGDVNFGIFEVQSINSAGTNPTNLWFQGKDGYDLVGVFNGIKVKSITGSGTNETTLNTGGVFNLYYVPKTQFKGDLGTAGYAGAGGGCTLGSLCYNGISNTAGGSLLLTMSLTTGQSLTDPSATLVANVNAAQNPPTGSAASYATITGDPQFGPTAHLQDNFCPNDAPITSCSPADGSNFALASSDPITATAVPEPSSLALLGVALLGFVGFLWRPKRNRA